MQPPTMQTTLKLANGNTITLAPAGRLVLLHVADEHGEPIGSAYLGDVEAADALHAAAFRTRNECERCGAVFRSARRRRFCSAACKVRAARAKGAS